MLYESLQWWLGLTAQVPMPYYMWAVFSPVWVPLVGAYALAQWNESRGY